MTDSVLHTCSMSLAEVSPPPSTVISRVNEPVRRASHRPVVASGSVPGYGPIFNAGLVHHAGLFHLFARAVRDSYEVNHGAGPRFINYVSDIAVFESTDGLQYEFAYVLARAGDFGVDCFEDPRIQVIHSRGIDRHVMTYTNLPANDGEPWRVGAHHLHHDGERFHLDPATGALLGPDGVKDKDAVIWNLSDGRVAFLHRIHPDMQLAIFDDLEHLWSAGRDYWDSHLADLDAHTIIRPSNGSLGIGAGAPPVATDKGLLLFFHERRSDGMYTMNLALLDDRTGRPISVLPEALLVPELEWEVSGDVDNVVFVQGAHLQPDGDTIYLVYGAADRHVGAATASASHLLELLLRL